MSSVFLYVAIVGIWALYLVPRWLRRAHSAPAVDIEIEIDYQADAQDYEDDGYGQHDAGDDDADTEPFRPIVEPRYVPAPPAPSGRARVLRARRRLLTMITALTVVAAVCTALGLTSWWACIPPAGMLGMYLLLLREAALADAGQARRRAAMEMRVRADRQRAPEEDWVHDEEPGAQIIDISARVGDQFYDQYADATVRAVGD
ncbi:MAG TPA: hypothetical protein VMR00_09150 [Streptosporangiaceae bacterium]|nr:hypothetical protein [Streptosporangiaceae bacterium]